MTMKRVLSLALALVMVLGLMSSAAIASGAPNSLTISGGSKEIILPVPGKADEESEPFTLSARSSSDAEFTPDESTVVWSVKEEPTGISVADGVVSVADDAAVGEYTLVATVTDAANFSTAEGNTVTAEKTFTVKKDYPRSSYIRFELFCNGEKVTTDLTHEGAPLYVLTIPADGAPAESYSMKLYDQYGLLENSQIAGIGVKEESGWPEADISGIEKTETETETGIEYGITISNTAKETIKRDDPVILLIDYSVYGFEGFTYEDGRPKPGGGNACYIKIQREEPAVASVEITSGAATIAIPVSGETKKTYTVTVLDQYGDKLHNAGVNWSIKSSVENTNITFDHEYIRLIVPAEGTVPQTVTLTAACGEGESAKTASVEVNIVTIDFTGSAAVADNPVYGTAAWDGLVNYNFVANVGGELVEGTYEFVYKDSGTAVDTGEGIPQAKEYAWEVLFTSNDDTYKDVPVKNGKVTISPKTVTATIGAVAAQDYTGSKIEPEVTVTFDGLVGNDALTAGTDYTVAISNNVNVGTAVITISDVDGGNYTVSGSAAFDIVAAAISDADVTLDWTTTTYSGEEQKPTVTVTKGETPLVENTDYRVIYENKSTDADTYEVVVEGRGNYSGSVSKTYEITKADQADDFVITIDPVAPVCKDEITLSTTGGSGTGLVSYEITEGSEYATLSGGKLTVTGVGTVTVKAAKAADNNYN